MEFRITAHELRCVLDTLRKRRRRRRMDEWCTEEFWFVDDDTTRILAMNMHHTVLYDIRLDRAGFVREDIAPASNPHRLCVRCVDAACFLSLVGDSDPLISFCAKDDGAKYTAEARCENRRLTRVYDLVGADCPGPFTMPKPFEEPGCISALIPIRDVRSVLEGEEGDVSLWIGDALVIESDCAEVVFDKGIQINAEIGEVMCLKFNAHVLLTMFPAARWMDEARLYIPRRRGPPFTDLEFGGCTARIYGVPLVD